jgi:hypothetical protein
LADRPKEPQEKSSAATTEERVTAAVDQVRLNNLAPVNELFLLDVVERMLCGILEQSDWPEHLKNQARFHARLIEDGVLAIRNEPNRSFVLNLIWAGLSLGMTSSPGLPAEDIERFLAQARSEMARVRGRKSGASRKAARRWVPHANELALTSYSDDPRASDEKLATDITFRWRFDSQKGEPKCPSVRTLSRFVAELRAREELPQRTSSRRT